MMAQPVPHQQSEKKRAKVYELRNDDWFDRGTGFCSFSLERNEDGRREAIILVESEDQPGRRLLETKVNKEDGFQKQKDTLIVWTEPGTNIDMALSFQEAEGCTYIWCVLKKLLQDDSLSDDLLLDSPPAITLPEAELGNLQEIEAHMRDLSQSANGRDALARSVMTNEYINKLIPLVEMAEDLESLQDLHRLCNIVKIIICLNDTHIIEHSVSDECVMGVVGALEYDPDFPSHKTNHRHWLSNKGRYKEVVPIEDEETRRKIHQTYRLQYLRDVVLARILDDPTFSVMNSLIFFNQVDIVQHLQSNAAFMKDVFGIFSSPFTDAEKKKEAVLFIQQCCSIAKSIQPQARQALFQNFAAHGLLPVINFGLRHKDIGARGGATDILVTIIEHDPHMIRQTIYRQMNENQSPLTDTLVDLLLAETDLGIRTQVSESFKVLLSPEGMPMQYGQDRMQGANGEFAGRPRPQVDPQQELFLTRFYERSAPKLFKPITDLASSTSLDFRVEQSDLVFSLSELLMFFVRNHHQYSRFFVLNNNIVERVGQLLNSNEKYLKLVAVRFFRALIGSQEEFFIRHLNEKRVLTPMLDVCIASISRDTLLSSASLEVFEYIKKENIKDLVKYLVENHRDKLLSLSYLMTFRDILLRYDQTQGYTANMDFFIDDSEEMGRRPPPGSKMMEHLSMDPAEEEYWNTSDPEDEDEQPQHTAEKTPATTNGSVTPGTPLVDYPSDEDDENVDPNATSPVPAAEPSKGSEDTDLPAGSESSQGLVSPPERLAEKRRREEDDEDELDKLSQNKRRNSTSAPSSPANQGLANRRRKSFTPGSGNANQGPKKIAISLSTSLKSSGGSEDES